MDINWNAYPATLRAVHLAEIYNRKFWQRVDRKGESECWLWIGPRSHANTQKAYGQFWLSGRDHISAHRFAYQSAHGSIPAGKAVCHHCDVRLCVNPSHLFLGTLGDNNTDRSRKGRTNRAFGDRNPASRLSEAQADAIRRSDWRRWGAQTALARQYGVAVSTINAICLGRSRKAAAQ